MIICKDCKPYICFNILICFLCLASSYYYGYLCAGRYHFLGGAESNDLWIVVGLEVTFLAHFVSQFFLEYEDESQKKVRDMSKIAVNYLRTSFILDFVPLLPFNFIPMYRKREYLFYILKMTRIYKGFEIFDVPSIMK